MTNMESGPVARMTAQLWFQLVFALMILLVLLGAVAGAQVIGHTNHVTDRLVEHTLPASAEAYRLQSALINQETGLRGYAIAADPEFLEPYMRGKQDQERAAGRLRELLADRPDLLADLDEIERGVRQWRTEYADPLAAAPSADMARARSAATTAHAKTVFDHMRAAFTAQNDHLAAAVVEDGRALDRARAIRNGVLVGMVLVFLLTGTVLIVLLRRLVIRPLAELAKSSLRVANGEFDHHIDGRGPADVVQVAAAVEDMRTRIVTELSSSRSQWLLLQQQKADLDLQAEELRRSNAELEQFAYVASHDLQEPLRKVASFCQLLEKRYGSQLDERGKQYIDFAVDGAKRMQVLINDLLTFSRVGRLSEGIEPVRLDRPLEKALTNLSGLIEDTDAVVERPEQLPEIMGEATLLIMLWQNLIGNAIKFRKADLTPVVRITVEPLDDDPSGRLFSVIDNGIGIAPEFAEKVFVIFQRLHARNEYSGTGIGLAVCKKIVEYHGGRIWIDTEYTEGTRICFTLRAVAPVVADESTAISVDAEQAGAVSTSTATPGSTTEGATT
ncbi:sensor histidine kinase [Nocardia paucivorans]|uniref:sensor histidine kinase n=1 Tax=Nocardia paucivorans TaxID=114259 RepID=UPI00030B902A|nr:sensor histidine kinase [Nocardia paucivorans]